MPTKRTALINSIICCMLLILGLLTFTLDVGKTYLTVTAPLSNGNRAGNQIGLMWIIDDQTTIKNLEIIADTLNNANAQATFFFAGTVAANHLDILQRLDHDFEIGNCGFTPVALNTADKHLIYDEIALCDTLLSSLTKHKIRWFTPPDTLFNKNTLAMADQLGYRTVLPTNRQVVINWDNADTSLVTAYATHDTQAGDIILLRPTTATMQCLSQIIATFLMRDLQITSLGQLLSA